MPGFDDVQIIVRPEELLDDRTVTLTPSDGRSFDERYDSGKDAFYHSLGWFVLSLPVAALSGGLFQTYYQTAESYLDVENKDDAIIRAINSSYNTAQTVFWVSAAASVGLAINAAFRLAQYIRSAR